MPCETSGNVTLCRPPRVRKIIEFDCPTCEATTEAIQSFGGALHADDFMCGTCLDIWMGGERIPRPFSRYWRRDRQKDYAEQRAEARTPDAYQAYVDWDLLIFAARAA